MPFCGLQGTQLAGLAGDDLAHGHADLLGAVVKTRGSVARPSGVPRLAGQQVEVDPQVLGRRIQAQFAGGIEQNVGIERAGQPGIVGQFGFQLPGFPARRSPG
jgi:hypothetical protein